MPFDPNDTAAADAGIFGLPFGPDDSRLHLIPVPWEVTTSYGDGASRGPRAILRASHQVDLFDLETGDVYKNGYYMLPIPAEIEALNREHKTMARKVVAAIENGEHKPASSSWKLQATINEASARVNDWVYQNAKAIFKAGRFPAVIGGDHSTPYGLLKAVQEETQGDFGILHVDAHADLRDGYQGYTHSHASIMNNVVRDLRPKALVQVAIRDFSEGEYDFIQAHDSVHTFFDLHLKRRLHRGESWQSICDDIVAQLPRNVHISFDIDGLSPELCPGTGTPVPGGLSFEQTLTLFATVVESGRRLTSFDLNEVAEPEEPFSDWDGNVGARLLFKLCGWLMISNGFRSGKKI